MMWRMVLACCLVAVASAAPDTILRFRSHNEVVRMEQEARQKQNDIKVLFGSFRDQLMKKSIVCPDGETQCSYSSTCCPLQNGQYGCCEGVNAVCCKDGVHCCPKGYQCDEQHGLCVSDALGISFGWADNKVVRARPIARISANKTCPDKKMICQEHDTCCRTAKGYGCCPLPNATCCSDGRHCCASGLKCDLVHYRCYDEDSNRVEPWVERRLEKSHSSNDLSPTAASTTTVSKKEAVICKDGLMCPDGNTCCLLKDGSYGCCPYSDAVCCSDHVHFCPNGCQYDYVKMGCVGHWRVHKWSHIVRPQGIVMKEEQSPVSQVQSHICPDQSTCPTNYTCCMMLSGLYGCCPMPDAVCCSDKIHCCPKDHICNYTTQQCQKKGNFLPWQQKQPAVYTNRVQSHICPDQSTCPTNYTCCMTLSGLYGCCPMPDAVCCSDKIHCCPKDHICNYTAQQCQKKGNFLPWQQKQPAVYTNRAKSVICPGGQSECPDGSTCCKLSTGQYGCCPLPNAVCCSDGVHCCPSGYTCDAAAQTCKKGDLFLPLVKKLPAKERAQSVICPGGQSQCPDGSTCCQLKSGQYGCCPLPKAVCCSDGVHCCPSGYTCDLAHQTCKKGDLFHPLVKKLPAKERAQSVICPGRQSECPDGSTCCKLSTGQYGCCPLPNAVCCSDGVHCCPSGYTCDLAHQTCKKGDLFHPLVKKLPAKERAQSVICPGRQSECPDGSTCCKLSTGQYGCCPLPNAVCCSDGVHCCPSGYTCDLAHQTCKKGDLFHPLVKKLPAKERAQSVICPGRQSECPDGSTCCKLSTGQYGCCPLPNAVCCSDGVHCCPSGYTCDLAHQTCKKGDLFHPLVKKLPAKERAQSVICPGRQSECPDGSTCCKLSTGQYGCCPLPNAVCCSDGVHCCPSGYTCDLAHQTCKKGDLFHPLVKKLPAKERAQSVICPGRQSECPDGSTCCKLSTGQYGCCPLPNAVCCSDGVHCCPSGYTCDLAHQTCKKDNLFLPLVKKLPAKERAQSVICPGRQSECPDGSTCCKLSTGQYGCCPLPNAVCCSDGVHCCPSGYTCDLAHQTCKKGDLFLPLVKKMPAKERAQSVVCPGGQSECPDGSTCCKLSTGQYGCCPLPNAVCCSDGVHCCPSGYTCDLAHQACKKGDLFLPLVKKLAAKERAQSVICPGRQSECPDGSTCCKLSTGQYGCCPLPNAVCCSDGVHCCPSGYTCDLAHQTCKKGDLFLPLVKKMPAKERAQSVVCPGGQSECPDGSTCCKLSTGQYGCCPLPNAVCCSDGVHCCPSGYTCDLAHQACKKGDLFLPLVKKLAAKERAQSVICPGRQSECPDGSTCCKLSTGQYGCCPLPNAVCCSDGVHCCPSGYTCDLAHQTCKKGDLFLPLVKKMPAKERAQSVVCPGGQSECPDGSTCCKLSTGQYGCCPLPNAVCCSDGVHCCPSGYTCDLAHQACKKGDLFLPLVKKLAAKERAQSVICPGRQSECPDGSTCCKLSTGQYGCCPLPNAVCCSDGVHCCPSGYTCDLAHQTCKKGDLFLPLVKKMPAKERAQSVVCPGGQSECPDGSTCCKLSTGQYGCCPLPNAVCCSDGVHCCPSGYTCDLAHQACKKGDLFLPLVKKLAAKERAQSVICPGRQSECPDGSTCCKLSTGQYGCCPLPNAVCCSDGVHCCPSGYTCDLAHQTCKKGDLFLPLVKKMPAKERAQSVVCPGGQSECPDGSTCCKLSTGQYGCCPLPNAVCCSDGVHCCPSGYTCDLAHQACKKGDLFLPLVKKLAAKERAQSVICPGRQSECPDGSTCCKLSTGQYGCCPLPNAVCCSDGVHCCPSGYTCDLAHQTCKKGDLFLPLVKKMPAKERAQSVVCPGGQSECPDGSTCCKLSTGQYGCCPLPNAVCCSDGVHCCPSGYTCDLAHQACKKGDLFLPLVKKLAAKERAQSVICPGRQSECPDGSTCCKLSTGQYGCCPLPNAVCCSDGVHCCPSGYTCDLAHQTCKKGDLFLPLVKKMPAKERAQSVVCPGGQSECPDGSTCCKLSTGQYGCCPLPNAVCCSDGVHCCPSGYTCDLAHQACKKGDLFLPLVKKLAAKERAQSVICPGRQSECPDGSTCCKLSTGQYGCCPLPNAVCCSDGVHCCPSGYTCDLAHQTCKKGDLFLPLVKKMPAKERAQSVICPGRQSECPDGSTCCKLSTGQYGCCPLPNAVCCSDGVHCCPSGYTCDLAHQTCKKGDLFFPWVEKLSAKQREQAVICPDGQSECPDGNTCCKLTSGQYGCCPLPNAVCCPDGVHCCPSGYTCDAAAQTCKKGDLIFPWVEKLSAKQPSLNWQKEKKCASC